MRFRHKNTRFYDFYHDIFREYGVLCYIIRSKVKFILQVIAFYVNISKK